MDDEGVAGADHTPLWRRRVLRLHYRMDPRPAPAMPPAGGALPQPAST